MVGHSHAPKARRRALVPLARVVWERGGETGGRVKRGLRERKYDARE